MSDYDSQNHSEGELSDEEEVQYSGNTDKLNKIGVTITKSVEENDSNDDQDEEEEQPTKKDVKKDSKKESPKKKSKDSYSDDEDEEEEEKSSKKKDSKKKEPSVKESQSETFTEEFRADHPAIDESRVSDNEMRDHVDELEDSPDEESDEENLVGTVMIEQSIGKEKCKLCPKYVDPDNHLSCPNCGQVYCTKCIQKHADSGKTCPECKEPIEKNKLKPSKLYQKMFASTNKKMKTLKDKNKKKEIKKETKENMFRCAEHDNETDLYCITCQKVICTTCVAKKSHNGHENEIFKDRYNAVKERLEIKSEQLGEFMAITSEELNKLAMILQVKPDDIQNWSGNIMKEIEKETNQFTEDYCTRIEEVKNIYETHNDPTKEVQKKLESLDELISLPPTPEALQKMENRDRDFKKKVVKDSKLLTEFMHNKKSKKSTKNNLNKNLLKISDPIKELTENRKDLSLKLRMKLAEALKKRIDEALGIN